MFGIMPPSGINSEVEMMAFNLFAMEQEGMLNNDEEDDDSTRVEESCGDI